MRNLLANNRVSSTVRRGRRVFSWVTYPHNFLNWVQFISWSLKEILLFLEFELFRRPEMRRRRVDFPAPLGPAMARICELLAVKETDLSMFVDFGSCTCRWNMERSLWFGKSLSIL